MTAAERVTVFVLDMLAAAVCKEVYRRSRRSEHERLRRERAHLERVWLLIVVYTDEVDGGESRLS